MEKTWEEFCKTGKVTDYLEYRDSVNIKQETEESNRNKLDGTGSCSDRYGFDRHANW